MSRFIRSFTAFAAGSVLMLLPLSVTAADGPEDQAPAKANQSQPKTSQSQSKAEPVVPEISLLDAAKEGLISVQAEGIGDGRMTMTLKNLTKKQLHVVLPPGLVAQSATGQFGGMGGMGGGMGGMGGGMGGMGGGMGGMGGGMGGMGGGMGGMGGGMGGMGGGMGGMGGGMRSVPPTDLPFALLNPGQTRSLPTRLVSVSRPDPDAGLSFPEKGEQLKVGDISQISDNPKVQKALRRLAADKAPTTLSQLVMCNLATGLDWDSISQLSQQWANRYELTLAQDFVDHLDTLPEGETGRLLFQADGSDAVSKSLAAELNNALNGKLILGLVSHIGVPARPEGPAVACRVRLTGKEALVQVTSSDAAARSWVPFGKFSLPLVRDQEKIDVARLSDSLAEGVLNRLVRIQLGKGTKDTGKLIYPVKIENFSPLILNGVAVVGTTSKPDEMPKVLSMICVSPRKSMTVPASDEVVRALGLKKGIKVVALDLSGL